MTTSAAEQINGLPYADYDALPGVRSSLVRSAAKSGLAYQHALDHPLPDSPAFRLGRATHTAVLEPLAFPAEYVLSDLSRAHYDTAKGIAAAVQAHPLASELLAQRGAAEVTITWTDPATGIACKARPDWLTDECLVDLKTTRRLGDADGFAFARSVWRYGYHAQMAFYQAGCTALGMEGLTVKFIVVESAPPHDVLVMPLPWLALELGRDECRKGLERIAAGPPWTGRAHDREVPIDVPEYILRAAGWEDDAA